VGSNAAEKWTPRVGREERAAAILACIPAVEDPGLSAVLASLIEGAWRRSVLGRAPAGFDALEFVPKIRAGFATYCAMGLCAIACSRRRPRALRGASRVAGALGLDAATWARRGLPLFYRGILANELDLVACAGAFILTIDEIFDDQLRGQSDDARIAAVDRVVRASGRVPGLAGDACAALVDALKASGEERWPAMAARLVEWADAEVRLERGDPSVEPRKAGIDVSMELLAFAAHRYVGDVELRWMQDIARLGQMIDDVLDIEKDLAAGRVTLGATGAWTVFGVGALYEKLVDDTRALIGETERNDAVRALYEQTFRAQIRHMAEVLVANP
jgi:hypothetical protein